MIIKYMNELIENVIPNNSSQVSVLHVYITNQLFHLLIYIYAICLFFLQIWNSLKTTPPDELERLVVQKMNLIIDRFFVHD